METNSAVLEENNSKILSVLMLIILFVSMDSPSIGKLCPLLEGILTSQR